MNGRFFAGRKVEASLLPHGQKFQKSGGLGDEEGEEADKKRLDAFADWLMKEGE